MFLNAILLLQSRLIFDYNELLAIYIYYIVEWVVYIFVFCFLSLFSFAAMHRDEWGFVRNCVTHNGNWHSIALNACETIFDQFLPHIYLLIFVPGYMWNMFRIYLYCCSVVSFNLCGSAACHWGGEKERERLLMLVDPIHNDFVLARLAAAVAFPMQIVLKRKVLDSSLQSI